MSFLDDVKNSTLNALKIVTKGYIRDDEREGDAEPREDISPVRKDTQTDAPAAEIAPPETDQSEDIDLNDYKNSNGNMLNKPPFVPVTTDTDEEEEEDEDKEKDEDFEQEREREEQQKNDQDEQTVNDDDEDDEMIPDEDYEFENDNSKPYSIQDSFTEDGFFMEDPFKEDDRPYTPWQ